MIWNYFCQVYLTTNDTIYSFNKIFGITWEIHLNAVWTSCDTFSVIWFEKETFFSYFLACGVPPDALKAETFLTSQYIDCAFKGT